jgi:siroheme synthase-like protein
MPGGDPSLFPVFLKLAGRAVLVVGAGPVAERKVEALVEAGARVRLVSPDATADLGRMADEGRLQWVPRRFEERDVEGAWLVVSATGDPDTQRRVTAAAEARRLFVLAVDDPPNASAYSGAIVRRPPFLVAISSSGATPALTRVLREIIEQLLPGPRWVEEARALRQRWLADGIPMGDRFGDLVRHLKDVPRAKP